MDKEEKRVEDSCPRSESTRDIKLPVLPKPLSLDEKKYLLAVERGDLTTVKRLLQRAKRHKAFNVNCRDPMGRGALLMAIDNENLQMLELLVIMGVVTEDALLHAIDKEFVEAVELLLEHEELIHKEGEAYSWEKVDRTTAAFTPEITPLILAAHRNNYEILKILLDRGATLPMPHDVRCGCTDCILSIQADSLRHSMSRINAYKALASPSLIALSSVDPILTAFELSAELRNLAYTENEFRQDYLDLRKQCQDFAVNLLSNTRSSQELAIVLNFDPFSTPYEDGQHMNLARLRLAIEHKQKRFVAHPNIQQLLGAIWYDGLPGFRRMSPIEKLFEVMKIAVLFPYYCGLYMLFPNSASGQLMRKPFMKFLIHASSYLFFLFLLILVSQRAEVLVVSFFGTESMKLALADELKRQRGNAPTYLECTVVIYVIGFLVEDTRELYRSGFSRYIRNMWNFIDMSRNLGYILVITLRTIAYYQQQEEIKINPSSAYIPREEWDDFDPQLVADGLFAMSNVFSALKLVHLFLINPYLGPLQICLGRMVIDIVKFFFIYSLVLFAFACGLNQLLWYFCDIEYKKCFSLPDGGADWSKNPEACMKWRRFHNLFETSQSLFWASFGMIGLDNFELSGIKSYTRFWGLLMFGSYSVINVVVLLNLLIAMMSNSYALITEHADKEWKFARSRLWLSYFEEGGTLPPPFILLPTPKYIMKLLGMSEKEKMRRQSSRRRSSRIRERDFRYAAVMRSLVWRFVTNMHRQNENAEVTEDDISEVKGDISSLRFELIDIFRKNNMDVSAASKNTQAAVGRKMRVWERRLLRDFHVVSVAGEEADDIMTPTTETDLNDPAEKFKKLAIMAVRLNKEEGGSNQVGSGKNIKMLSQIGRSTSTDSFKSCQNLKKAMAEAKKLAVLQPTPEASPRLSPIPTPGTSVLELIRSLEDEKSDSESIEESEGQMPIPPKTQEYMQRRPSNGMKNLHVSVTPATPTSGSAPHLKATAPGLSNISEQSCNSTNKKSPLPEPLEPLRTNFTSEIPAQAIPPPPIKSRALGNSSVKRIDIVKKEVSLDMPEDEPVKPSMEFLPPKQDCVIDMRSKTLEKIKESKVDIELPSRYSKSKTIEPIKASGEKENSNALKYLQKENENQSVKKSLQGGIILTPKILEPTQVSNSANAINATDIALTAVSSQSSKTKSQLSQEKLPAHSTPAKGFAPSVPSTSSSSTVVETRISESKIESETPKTIQNNTKSNKPEPLKAIESITSHAKSNESSSTAMPSSAPREIASAKTSEQSLNPSKSVTEVKTIKKDKSSWL